MHILKKKLSYFLAVVLLLAIELLVGDFDKKFGFAESSEPKPEAITDSSVKKSPAPSHTKQANKSVKSEKSTAVKKATARKIPKGAEHGEGRVINVLPDDNEGSRHQRFIIRLPDRSTLLVAHNIDLAPRVPVQEGDVVEYCGEYEYNDRGGVIHWTHRDPGNRHFHGWLKHKDRYYE